MPNGDVFKALADPTRREILRMLHQQPEMSAGQIAEVFDMTAPSVSHHFSVLKAADLISQRREGQQILYSINTSVVEDLMATMFEMFRKDRRKER